MESELVSGFMTEHSSVIFVFFFLAEYASIVLMCILMSVLFLGGYLLIQIEVNNYIILGLLNSIVLGIKSSLLIFSIVWVRASFPRIRFDQLMMYCWTILLPIIIAILVLIPCIMYIYDIL